MPRIEAPSNFQRFMMQAIMWVILGATVGLAALVNQSRERLLRIELGSPMEFEGFSLKLPQGWEPLDPAEAPNALTAIRDPNLGDELHIATKNSLLEMFSPGARGTPIEDIPLGDGKGRLMLRQVVILPERIAGAELFISRSLQNGKILTISLVTMKRPQRKALAREIEVMKKVAESLRVDQ